jgi:hypothetical protein
MHGAAPESATAQLGLMGVLELLCSQKGSTASRCSILALLHHLGQLQHTHRPAGRGGAGAVQGFHHVHAPTMTGCCLVFTPSLLSTG